MKVLKIVTLAVFLVLSHSTHGQTVLENIPAGIQWYQINTPHFKVLFQDGFNSEASQMANLLETLYQPTSQTLEADPHKIPLLLQNRSSISNGFVALAPRRSEFYTMPPQDYNFLGTNLWLDLLAVHELRHVVQYEKSRVGFTKLASTLLGEQAQVGLANLSTPAWFWEGDAVGIETGLTPSGRGRIPNFHLVFRTTLLERGGWDYSKQFLRSFQHFVPNHYLTGYFLTTFVRRKHHPEVWSDITRRTFSIPVWPDRFSSSIKKATGKNLDENYEEMLLELKTLWQNELEELELTPINTLTEIKKKEFTEYMYPQLTGEGEWIALLRGIGDIETFIWQNEEGKQKEVFIPGLFNDPGQLSVENNTIVWGEYGFNPRWRSVNYSNIKTFNLKNGQVNKLTKRGRYAAPVLSPDGQKIAAVLTTIAQEYYLVIMDAGSGRELKRISTPGTNRFIAMPRWSADGLSIVALSIDREGKSVFRWYPEEDRLETLLPPSSENIGHPILYEDFLLYNSPISGIDNIYALQLSTGQRYQVTNRPYGAYNPDLSFDGKWLYFNDFTAEGMQVSRMPFELAQWVPLGKIEYSEIGYYQTWEEQEDNPDILTKVEKQDYPVKPYNRFWHSINPHSWGPILSTDANNLTLGVNSQDVLSTTEISAGFNLNVEEQTGNWFARVSYQALFPVLDFAFERRGRQTFTRVNDQRVLINYNEDNWNAGIRLPLLLTDSRYIQNLTLSAYTRFLVRHSLSTGIDSIELAFNPEFRNSNIMDYSFRYNRLLKMSKRDIRPRWGLGISGGLKHAPWDKDFDATQVGIQGYTLLPGIFKHHSLLLRGGYQQETGNSLYPYASIVQYPRGYLYEVFGQLLTGSLEYALPLLYPDFHIGKLLNFQRIKTNLFYDAGVGITNGVNNYFNSVGVDLTADMNFFRLLPLIEVGVRTSYVPEMNNYRYDLILNYRGF